VLARYPAASVGLANEVRVDVDPRSSGEGC